MPAPQPCLQSREINGIVETLNTSGKGKICTYSPVTVTAPTLNTLNTPTLVTEQSTKGQYIAAAGGAIDATKAVYNFVSTNGDSIITTLKFTVNDTPDAITSVKIGSVSAGVVQGKVVLHGLNIPVPEGQQGVNVEVLVSYASVGIGGLPSGSPVGLILTYAKYGAKTNIDSTKELTLEPAGIKAPSMALVGSIPKAISFVPVSDRHPVGSISKIGSVNIAADQKGSVKINTLVFDLNILTNANRPIRPKLINLSLSDGY
jgi:hypothetical protein